LEVVEMDGKVLVTGCAGFIGSHLVERLLEEDHHVIGIDNMRTGNHSNMVSFSSHPGFRFIEVDVCDPDLKSKLSSDIDLVFHLAAISSVTASIEDPILVNRNNVTGIVNVLDIARALDVSRVVFSSSAAVYGNPEKMPIVEETPLNPLSPYAASKIAGEEYMKAFHETYGIETTILRYFNVYGPRQAYSEYSGVISIFINHAIRGEPITVEGDGKQTRSFVYVTDMAKATVLAGKTPQANGEVINMSGLDLIRILDVANKINQAASSKGSKIIHVDPRIGDVRHSIGSMEKAQSVLGFTPEMPFETGLEHTINWYRSHMQ
jgi:UDP-glucose 4-epimerase